jgi:aminopeptidase
MKDHDKQHLSQIIVSNSLDLKPGQKVYIDAIGQVEDFIQVLLEEIANVGAQAYLRLITIPHLKSIISKCTKEQIMAQAKHEIFRLKNMDAYIGIRGDENVYEFNDLPKENYNYYIKHYLQPIQATMASLKKWLLIRYPTYGLAQLGQTSLFEFENLFYRSCSLNYEKLSQEAKKLGDWMTQTDRVRIYAPGTDLSFSIKGMSHFICDGKYNLPDGEIFTAPVLDSVEGTIQFNVPSSYMGLYFNNIRLELSKGEIVSAMCNDTERLEEIISTDKGSSRIGEFGIGLNTVLTRPLNSLPFDEKMAGSIHLAIGQAYDMAYNGNESSVHWDLVLSQLEINGGGELYFDNTLVRKNGLFIPEELKILNQL